MGESSSKGPAPIVFKSVWYPCCPSPSLQPVLQSVIPCPGPCNTSMAIAGRPENYIAMSVNRRCTKQERCGSSKLRGTPLGHLTFSNNLNHNRQTSKNSPAAPGRLKVREESRSCFVCSFFIDLHSNMAYPKTSIQFGMNRPDRLEGVHNLIKTSMHNVNAAHAYRMDHASISTSKSRGSSVSG